MSTQNDLVKNEAEVKNQGFDFKVMSISEINTLRLAGKFDSSVAYQRGLKNAWLAPVYRADFLDSIFKGFYCGAICAVSRKNGVLELMDGKQRLNFIGLTLDSLMGFEGVNEDLGVKDLNKIFNEWHAEDKKVFLEYKIPFIIFEGLDDSDKLLQFQRLQAGIKLTKIETYKGKILNILALEDLKKSVNELLSILPDTAGRKACYDSAEEIILQSLSYVIAENCDFKGYTVIDTIKNSKMENIKKGLKIINNRVNAIKAMIQGAEAEDNSFKWVLKKTVLNSLLCVNVDSEGDYNSIGFSTFRKTAEHREAGQDQKDFKGFSNSATAEAENVKGRISILEKIQAGKFTKNIEKDIKEKTVKKVEKGFSIGSKNEGFEVDEKTFVQFKKNWGSDSTIENIKKVFDYVLNAEGKIKTVNARLEKTGVKSFGFQGTDGKFKTVPLSELLVKAEVVKTEAVKIQSVIDIH